MVHNRSGVRRTFWKVHTTHETNRNANNKQQESINLCVCLSVRVVWLVSVSVYLCVCVCDGELQKDSKKVQYSRADGLLRLCMWCDGCAVDSSYHGADLAKASAGHLVDCV